MIFQNKHFLLESYIRIASSQQICIAISG